MLESLKGNFEEDENGIGLSLSLSIGGNYTKKIDRVCNSDDEMLIEMHRSKKRAIHREMMENEEFISKQTVGGKREIGSFGNECRTCDEAVKNLNLSLNQDSYVNNQNLAVHKKNAPQGIDICRGFKLYNENRCGNVSYNQCRSSDSEGNLSGKNSFENYKALSNGSTERCSLTISECQSLSPKGRSSSDMMPIKEQQDQTEEKNQQQNEECHEIKNGGMLQLLSRMPCVSATGNCPNGKKKKKINGLLCKYDSKTEINIVCLCHGKSFTPSEFVEHAGGVDVSHQPLRHITVTPSCFPRNPV